MTLVTVWCHIHNSSNMFLYPHAHPMPLIAVVALLMRVNEARGNLCAVELQQGPPVSNLQHNKQHTIVIVMIAVPDGWQLEASPSETT